MKHAWRLLLCAAFAFVFSTWAFTVAAQEAKELELPIVHQTMEHEVEQFDYNPWFVRNEVSFDQYNRPYIRSRTTDLHETGFIQTMRHSRWVNRDFTQAIVEAYPGFSSFIRGGGWIGADIVFDADDDLYTIVRIRLINGSERNVLLYSTDYGTTFQVYELPAGKIAMEHWVGHNTLTRPPLLGIFQERAPHPATYASYNNFSILQMEKKDGRLEMGETLFITSDSIAPSLHSGGASFAVSSGDKTFFTWFEATDQGKSVPGVPTYVATYDSVANEVVDRVLLAHGAPANDSHNTPGIVIDSTGYLHVISGSHGVNFYYVRSKAPLSTGDGWTEPIKVLETGAKGPLSGPEERGRQTYLAFLADQDDTLHIAYRQWREGVDTYFGGRLYGALSYQQKPVGEPWQEPLVLVVPAVPTYSVFYHKLTLDRLGRLFLSYNFRSNVGQYEPILQDTSQVYKFRALLTSADGGYDWQLATSPDFARGVHEDAPDAGYVPGQIEGSVVNSSALAVSGATVQAGPVFAVTDENGRFVLHDIFVNEVALTVEHDAYRLWQRDVTLPERDAANVEVIMVATEEVAVDFDHLWAGAFKFRVDRKDSDDGWTLLFSGQGPTGVTFDLDQDDVSAMRFEARLERPAFPGFVRELDVTATHTGGNLKDKIQLTTEWQTYEIATPHDMTRLNMVLVGDLGIDVGIRNVRVVTEAQ